MKAILPKRPVGRPPASSAPRKVGRPKGTILESTALLRKEKEVFNKHASLRARKILDAQTVVALGTYHLVELFRDKKNPAIVLGRHIIRSMQRQEELLESGNFEYGFDFIFVEGTPPDFRAGDAILNRAWGKPKETLEVEGEVKFSLKALHTTIAAPDAARLPPIPAKILRITTPDDETPRD